MKSIDQRAETLLLALGALTVAAILGTDNCATWVYPEEIEQRLSKEELGIDPALLSPSRAQTGEQARPQVEAKPGYGGNLVVTGNRDEGKARVVVAAYPKTLAKPGFVKFLVRLRGEGLNTPKFWCLNTRMDFGDGVTSKHSEECEAFEEGDKPQKSWEFWHRYVDPGEYKIKFDLVRTLGLVDAVVLSGYTTFEVLDPKPPERVLDSGEEGTFTFESPLPTE